MSPLVIVVLLAIVFILLGVVIKALKFLLVAGIVLIMVAMAMRAYQKAKKNPE